MDTSTFQDYRSSRLSYLSAATYMRLTLPQQLPVTMEYVLYLDADLLVLGELDQLWQARPTTVPAQAAVDVPNPTLTPAGLADLCREHGLDPQATNHNTGVMLLNLKQWRQESLAEHCFTYLERYGRNPGLPHGDQDAINLVLAGRWGTLSPEWNIPIGWRYTKAWQRYPNPGIWHFITAVKPWMSHKPWYPPLRRYASYLQASGWFSPWEYLTWWWQAVSPNLRPALSTVSEDIYRRVRSRLAQAAGRVHRRK
ncbi:MAG: hypothetical protein IGQ88_07230 [Gloeomargaritaceae cyanobacterium C42_A2020_066]|nr:hypothetical protein [Gloeomargaritaceae cyanobacterium C42_A2020_066]